MGLDLAWAVLPPDTVARLDEIRACGSGRPCGHDPRCSDAYSEIARGYEFRYRRLERFVRPMLELGMGFEAGQLDIDAGQAFANPAGWLAYDAAAAQERRPSGLSGIPVFKLRSNDAWLVTAREVTEALAHYDALPQSARDGCEADDSWRDWLAWLRVTRLCGGFTVE